MSNRTQSRFPGTSRFSGARRGFLGFTIVELMVTLAVASVLIGFALPAFNDFVRQRTMASRMNDFLLAITYARSEAIRRGINVSLQAEDDDDANEWGGGYCVVVGNSDCDDDDDVLRRYEAMEGVTFDATGALDDIERLTFNTRGMLANAGAGRIELCSTDDTVDPGRAVDITATGRADYEELECHP
ncbi:MAG: GspH/FimT family pseudopilin [Pseudomonadales bacterium]